MLTVTHDHISLVGIVTVIADDQTGNDAGGCGFPQNPSGAVRDLLDRALWDGDAFDIG